MLERFAPRFATLPCDSQSGATGEMIHAAAEIGAPLQNMDLVECTPGSLPGSDLMVRLDIRPNRMIMVDLEGKRFVDESGYRSEGEENFVGDSEIIALGGASNETKDRPLG